MLNVNDTAAVILLCVFMTDVCVFNYMSAFVCEIL